jgi:drug/metabolite transporter (DMT)-like permease
MKNIIVILISVILTVAGQLLWKIGANQAGQVNILPGNFVQETLRLFTNIWVVAGCLIFIISSILWVVALTNAHLSYVYPFLALGYVLVALFSWLFLHEPISMLRLSGMILVCAGVMLVAKS